MHDPSSNPPGGQWWHKPFSMFQTNLREIDVDMNVEEVADYIVDYGANAWLISIGGIQAQYPTSLPWHPKNPMVASHRKSGDLISDALQAAHSRGLRLLARMDFSKVSATTAAEHPDWCYTSPEGNLQTHTADLVSVCPSGPYYQEHIFSILDEVTRLFPLDGLFINWTSMNEFDYYKQYHGVCHCTNCQSRWLSYTSSSSSSSASSSSSSSPLPLPTSPTSPTYPLWLLFSTTLINDLTSRIRSFLSSRLPSACLILPGPCSDVVFHEANNSVGKGERDPWWHHTTSEVVSAWRSFSSSSTPVLVNSTTFLDMPYRFAGEDPEHFASYLLQCISRGGIPSTYMMGYPGRMMGVYKGSLGMGKGIMRFYAKWRGVYEGLRGVAGTVLIRPEREGIKMKSGGGDDGERGKTRYEESLAEYRGLYLAMQESHVPFDVLSLGHLAAIGGNDNGSVEDGALARYRVLILPDVGELGAKEVEVLDKWVAAGGRLVATGSSGIAQQGSGVVQLASLPSKTQRAVVSKREMLFSTYFAPEQKGVDQDPHYYEGPVIPVHGSCYLMEWKDGTTGRYKMLARAPFAPPEKAYGNVQVDHRGCGIGDYGQGKGIVIPFTIGRGYREIGLQPYRKFFIEILKEEALAAEFVSCEIADQVEVTMNRNAKNQTVLHLINMSGARRQNMGSHLPISGGLLRISSEGKQFSVRSLATDATLEVKDGVVELPVLDLFDVIVIEES